VCGKSVLLGVSRTVSLFFSSAVSIWGSSFFSADQGGFYSQEPLPKPSDRLDFLSGEDTFFPLAFQNIVMFFLFFFFLQTVSSPPQHDRFFFSFSLVNVLSFSCEGWAEGVSLLLLLVDTESPPPVISHKSLPFSSVLE